MSVSLSEVLKSAGYDIKNNLEDARWLLNQESEFEELLNVAEKLENNYTEYEEFIGIQEELNNFDNPTWEEWRRTKNEE